MGLLGATALTALAAAIQRAGQRRITLYLGLPPTSELPANDVGHVLETLRQAVAPLELALPEGGVYAYGRAAVFMALRDAVAHVSRGAGDVLVGGIDCSCDTTSLVDASIGGQLLGFDNIDGRIAGEGAGFVWLAAKSGAPVAAAPPRILDVADHDGSGFSREPDRAEGLAAALRQLRLAPHLQGVRVDRLLSCQPNQTRWATQLAWAYLRNASLCPEPFEPQSIAESLGDTGAAAGALALALASRADGVTLVLGVGDGGESGACVLGSGEPARLERSPNEGRRASARLSLREHPEVPSFLRERCEEHLEELGILLELRSDLLRDPDMGWRGVEELEQRMVARRRALAHYGELARGVANAALAGSDAELAAGAALAASNSSSVEDSARLVAALGEIEPDERPRWTDALVWGGRWSVETLHQFAAMLDTTDATVALAGMRLLDRCCQCDSGRTLRWLDQLEPGSVDHDFALLHVARWGEQPEVVRERLATLTMRGPTIEAALWIGHLEPLQALRAYLRQGHEFARALAPYLAVLGGAGDTELIQSRAAEDLRAEEFEALGRIGLGRSVPVLLSALGQSAEPDVASTLAEALERVCGAGLYEEVEVLVDPDEPPELVERVSVDPERWAAWWHEHQARFDAGRCYRRGRIAGPLALVDELLDPRLSPATRRHTLLDLRIRASLPLRLGMTWPVVEQLDVLRQARAQLDGGAAP
ncbi:hypothetical protein [Enhygromyxa salina]|nr:hypothetical protein [Enhygromyxa salina]